MAPKEGLEDTSIKLHPCFPFRIVREEMEIVVRLYDMVGHQDPKILITSYYWKWSPVEDKLTI